MANLRGTRSLFYWVRSTSTTGYWVEATTGGLATEVTTAAISSTSATTVLGFLGITGSVIPVGEGVLTQVTFTEFEGVGICFGEDTGSAGSTVISDYSFPPVYVAANWGECYSPQDEIYGCTYDTATNYNADATFDDGSCEFLWGDLNHDGILNVMDIVSLVNAILSGDWF